MKKYLIVYAIISSSIIALCLYTLSAWHADNKRLRQNQSALAESIHHYRTRLGQEVASVTELRLLVGEYKEMRAEDARRIRELGIRLQRAESVSKSVTQTTLRADTILLHDTVFVPAPPSDTLHSPTPTTIQHFHWCDKWVTIDGEILNDKVECRIECRDTLRQIVHRVPRHFLGIPFGTHAVRQEIFSDNPHTRIAYTEYVTISRRTNKRKRR